MGAWASEGIDLFKIANRSISEWVPSFRLAKDFERFGKTGRQRDLSCDDATYAQTFRQAICFLKGDQQSNTDQQRSLRNR
jgi:hypothetical protein